MGIEDVRPAEVLRLIVEQSASGVTLVEVEPPAGATQLPELPAVDTLLQQADWDNCIRALRAAGWRLSSGGEFVSSGRRIWKFRRDRCPGD